MRLCSAACRGKRMEKRAFFQSCVDQMKENPAEAEKAKKAIFWLYLLMAVGILLPLLLFLILR